MKTHPPPLPLLLAVLAALTLGGCASAPPPQLYQLRAEAPAAAAPVLTQQVLLLQGVRLPELLEHSALLLPQGQAGVQPLDGHRWAEPLRDAVPRLLRQDLAALLGEARVWAAPLPAGVVATRRLQVEVLSLQAQADRRSVRLQARYTLGDIGTGVGTGSGTGSGTGAPLSPPRVGLLQIDAASSGPTPDALVAAHRLALWQLAQQLAAVAAP